MHGKVNFTELELYGGGPWCWSYIGVVYGPYSLILTLLCHEHNKLYGVPKMDFGKTVLTDHLG